MVVVVVKSLRRMGLRRRLWKRARMTVGWVDGVLVLACCGAMVCMYVCMVVDGYIYIYIYINLLVRRDQFIKVHTEEDTESENRIPFTYERESRQKGGQSVSQS